MYVHMRVYVCVCKVYVFVSVSECPSDYYEKYLPADKWHHYNMKMLF